MEKEGLAERFFVDSAGTHAYHVGNPPDPRAQRAALMRGIDIGGLRARQVSMEDFETFQHILAMDRDNYAGLMSICPRAQAGKVRLFLDYAQEQEIREVPDPYYGGAKGFEQVLDLIEEASRGFLAAVGSPRS